MSSTSSATVTNDESITFKWDIPQYCQLPQKYGEAIVSHRFPSTENRLAYWRLKLYPKGRSKSQSRNFVTVFLQLVHAVKCPIDIQGKLLFRDSNGTQFSNVNINSTKFLEVSSQSEHTVWQSNFDPSKLANSTNGTVSIVVEISYKENVNPEELDTDDNVTKGEDCLRDMKYLLSNPVYSDFVIHVKGRRFQAHKAILYVRSSVFAAMLDSKMKETNTNEATIDDLEPDIFEKLLEFVYSGRVTKLGTKAIDILQAADKYDMSKLKNQCENELCSELSEDNIVKMLLLADKHNANILKQEAILYILAIWEKVTKSADWSLLNEAMVTQLLCAAFKMFTEM